MRSITRNSQPTGKPSQWTLLSKPAHRENPGLKSETWGTLTSIIQTWGTRTSVIEAWVIRREPLEV